MLPQSRVRNRRHGRRCRAKSVGRTQFGKMPRSSTKISSRGKKVKENHKLREELTMNVTSVSSDFNTTRYFRLRSIDATSQRNPDFVKIDEHSYRNFYLSDTNANYKGIIDTTVKLIKFNESLFIRLRNILFCSHLLLKIIIGIRIVDTIYIPRY